ncbi:MAG: flagellar basal body P-ring protein FlgI [Candidatus Cloacimonetes bacterium]|nr:flagellar basal body P-ring protein FlgI [Candidatus Cloacimonadota bacterium]
MKRLVLLLLLVAFCGLHAQVRLKDIATFSGLEARPLIGYGLVVGLDGTGDGSSSQMTVQSIKNMMERFGIMVPMNKIRPNNVAAVMITATLPPFAKVGGQFDVTVSSLGDAKSLEGGMLLLSPLMDVEQNLLAMAQGAVSIGGFNTESGGSRVRRNYALVGRVPGGATVHEEVYSQLLFNGELMLNLRNPDFTTVQRVATAINEYFDLRLAAPEDGMSVQVVVPDSVLNNRNLIGFISQIENLQVMPEQAARVVINERTGTIVAGGDVRITQVAVAHGNLTIKVAQETQTTGVGVVGAGGAAGIVQTTTGSSIEVIPEDARVSVIETATVQDLARALNRIETTPRDLIAIFQSLKAAGALQAELVIL